MTAKKKTTTRKKKKPTLTIRPATLSDVPGLVELNRVSYPQMAEDNIV